MLGWLVYDQGIEPHVSVFAKSARREGTFQRDAFTNGHQGDVYFCPAVKMLMTKGTLVNEGVTLIYRGSQVRLRRLQPEGQMHPASTGPKDTAIDLRGRATS